MKQFVPFVLLFSMFVLQAQEEMRSINTEKKHHIVSFSNYDPFFDTINDDVTHSAVRPFIIKESPIEGWSIQPLRRTKPAELTEAYHLFPVVNQLFSTAINEASEINSFRSHLGVGGVFAWGEKWSMRGTITAGYFQRSSETNNLNGVLANTYFYSGDESRRWEVDPRFRMSYKPNKFFNLQAGIDHNFIGEGQRSMLLGDYGATYPFAKLRSSLWRFEFINLYQFFREEANNNWIPKYAASHYLNFQVTKRLQIGVFESVVFEPKDTLLKRGYEWEYLNPFLFYRPTEYSIGSQDRIVIGTHFNYDFGPIMLYGQYLIDDFVLSELLGRTRWWGNKFAGQLGFKGKFHKKNLQINYFSELNFVRPFTYSHLGPQSSYSHQGISLAHPLGANLAESYTGISMHFKSRLKVELTTMFSQQGGSDGTDEFNFGDDINLSYVDRPFEYGFFIGGNGKRNRMRTSINISYPIMSRLAIEAFVRPIYEIHSGSLSGKYLFLFGGIRTNLWNERSHRF